MLEILTAQHGQAVSEVAMGSSELSVFSLPHSFSSSLPWPRWPAVSSPCSSSTCSLRRARCLLPPTTGSQGRQVVPARGQPDRQRGPPHRQQLRSPADPGGARHAVRGTRLRGRDPGGQACPAPRTAAFPAPSSDAGTRDFSHPKYM